MIIDSHVHIGRNKHINASVKELLTSMDDANIDKALVFAGELNDAPNEWVIEQVSQHKDRLYAVGAYDHSNPGKSPWGQGTYLADFYSDKKIVAVKFYTGYDHFYPSDMKEVLKRLESVGCPAIFHSGDCLNSVKHAKLKYAHPLHIDDVANDYPKMNFVIAHVGNPWCKDTAAVCYKNDNVYTDISGFVYGKFQESDRLRFKLLIDEFLSFSSSDKLLFGSDFPISDQMSYLSTLDKLYGEALSPRYLTQNVKKVFKLP